MNVIEIGGARYIKAIDAAKKVGYTTDYVGQLARAGKIDGQQIGRAWYIKEEDILEHKKGNGRSNKQKSREAVQKVIAEEPEHAIYNTMYAPPAYVPEYRKRLLDTSVRYEADSSPLTVSLEKKEESTAREEVTHLAIVPDRFEDAVHMTRLGRDVPVHEESSARSLEAERAPLPPMRGAVIVHEVENEPDTSAPVEEASLTDSDTAGMPFREPVTQFAQRLQVASTHTPQTAHAREIAFIPHNAPGPRLPLSLRTRLATALVPLALLLTFAVACSSVFLEKVVVYERGNDMTMQPTSITSYRVIEVATVLRAVSR